MKIAVAIALLFLAGGLIPQATGAVLLLVAAAFYVAWLASVRDYETFEMLVGLTGILSLVVVLGLN